MRKLCVLLLTFVLLAATVIIGSASTLDDQLDVARQSGYKAGYDEGYYNGHSDGYDKGYERGYEAGHDQGVLDGIAKAERKADEKKKEMADNRRGALVIFLSLICISLIMYVIDSTRRYKK
jgi:flagellar biosynthesis/type III secretory pathway protein FliH